MEDLYRKATITIPFTIFSRNKIDKMHWSEKSKLKKTYALFIRNQMRLNKIPSSQVEDYFKLTIVSKRIRKCDFDNLVGGAKQLIDALSDERFIWDDAPKYLDLNMSQEKCKDRKEEVVITRELIRV